MRRLPSTSPCAACRRAHVDLAMSSLLTEAICTRQPPAGPDMPSIRLAMLGAGSVLGAGVGAWVTVGCLSGGVAGVLAGGGVGPAPLDGMAAGWIGVGVLAASAGSGLGGAGTGRPF